MVDRVEATINKDDWEDQEMRVMVDEFGIKVRPEKPSYSPIKHLKELLSGLAEKLQEHPTSSYIDSSVTPFNEVVAFLKR